MTEEAPKNSGNENETVGKDQHIEDLRQEVNEVVDGLNYPIDEGIKETVIFLMANDFPTVASCEGHIWTEEDVVNGDGPYVTPWVDVVAPEPEGWQQDSSKEKLWKTENGKLQARMLSALDEFYIDRSVAVDAHLVITPLASKDDVERGAFRLSNQGRMLMQTVSPEKQAERQPVYRKEMQDFTEFLRKKYYE